MIIKSPYSDVDIPNIPLTEYLLERMSVYGDKPALIDGPTGRTLSYREFSEAIRRVGAGLAQRGVEKGDVLAIYSSNQPEYVVAFHAVSLIGGVITTMSPLSTPHEVARQLNDACAKYLLTQPQLMDKAQAAAAKADIREIFVFGEAEGATPFAELLNSEGQPPEVAINPLEDMVALPYSSGTTGLPKGVMLTHYNLVANVTQRKSMVGTNMLDEQDVVIGFLPFYHIYGMVVLGCFTLMRGATMVIMPRFDLAQFLSLIERYRVTHVNLVPPLLVLLAKDPIVDDYDLSSLISLGSGGAPLGEEVWEAVTQRIGCAVTQGYGMTETSPTATARPTHLGAAKRGSVGPSLPNMEMMIVDIVSGEPLGAHQRGEVWMRGPNIMKGYLNRPDATAATITAEGWLKSGDIGYVDEDGFLYIVDRLKELIKYKGFQVPPAELEALLLGHDAIADVAVIPSPDEEAGEVPKAFIVKKAPISADEIMSWVAQQVAPQKKIRRVEFVEKIPKSLSGKILRRLLVQQERAKRRDS
ncbi:MAG: 4-coumarate--CoA ligase family protein [Ardenticatenaceae bacterium]